MAITRLNNNSITSITALPSGCTSASGLDIGSLSMVDSWRITSNINANNEDKVLTGWERCDYSAFSQIGTGMTESSGTFSFPQTGIYLVMYQFHMVSNADANEQRIRINFSTDNFSSSTNVTETGVGATAGSVYEFESGLCQAIVDVTNTSTHKFKLTVLTSGAITVKGDSTTTETGVTVMRLGDT